MLFVIFVLPAMTILAVAWMICNRRRGEPDTIYIYIPTHSDPFSVSEYWGRIERAQLDILEEKKPVDQTVILWWGLDGLTLDEYGELKWISRKKPEPVNQNVFYQPCQSILYADNQICEIANTYQSTQARIDALRAQNAALQMQAAQQAMMVQMQNCCTRPIWM